MTQKKVGGYVFEQELVRAVNANRAARRELRRMVDEENVPQALALMMARAANALGENLDAIEEIERLVKGSKVS